MTQLVGTGIQGDFVLKSQETAKIEGFKNVSKIWYDKTISFDDGLKQIREGYAKTEDILATVEEMQPIVKNDKVVFKYRDSRTFKPTEYGFNQIGSKFGVGTWFVESMQKPVTNQKGDILYERDWRDAKTLVAVLTNASRRLNQTKKFLWRTRKDGTLRAMLTDKYLIINNEWLLETWKKYIPGGRLSHWRGDSDTIYGNILIPDSIREETDSDYGGMISCGNSEIGQRQVSQYPSVFRAICMNGCIWDQTKGENLSRVHRGKLDLSKLEYNIMMNIQTQIPLINIGIDRLLNTRSFGWDGASMKPLFAQVVKDYKFTKIQASTIYNAYSEELRDSVSSKNNLFGIINSVTRAGQKFSNEDWVKADEIGGRLSRFDKVSWESLSGRAKKLTVEQTDEVFA